MPQTMNFCPQCGNALIERPMGGKLRKACQDDTCGYVFWNNPIPVVAAIVERNDHIVLVRSHGWPESWFGLITGFLEEKESTEEAVLREVKEEIGLDAHLGSLIGIYPFFRMNQIIIAYHVIAQGGDIKLEKEELAAFKEVAIKKVQPWPMGTGIALRDWLRSKGIERDFIKM